MINANQYNLTWNHFEEIHEDTRTAFENLCRSLFKKELCTEDTILHSNPNHPGVEAEPVIGKNGRHISFQAKYFESTVGYRQIENSAEKIIKHYSGSIDIVYLYSNKDILATSIPYKRIETMLNKIGTKVILVTGQTILDQAADHPTILSTYFGIDFLGTEWFKDNLELSLDNLGKRYNSIFNIDTDAQKKLEIFLREDAGLLAINQKKIDFSVELQKILRRCQNDEKNIVKKIKNELHSIPDISENTISESLMWKESLQNTCRNELTKLDKIETQLCNKSKKLSDKQIEYKSIMDNINRIEQIRLLFNLLDFSCIDSRCITSKIMLVKGKMGTGKSQLLASAAKRLSESGRTVLLFLGQTFITLDAIEKQMLSSLKDLTENQTLESLFYIMEENAEKVNKDAVIFIDAINESYNRDMWKQGINKLVLLIKQFKHLRLVISIRSGFEQLTLSDKFICESEASNGEIAVVVHTGFMNDSPHGIYEFLSKNNIPFSPDYYLQSEMSNPLFLMWFCQTYSKEESDLFSLIEKVISSADKEASKEIGIGEPLGAMFPLLEEIILYNIKKENKTLTKNTLLNFTVWDIYGITQKIPYLKAAERYGIINTYAIKEQEVYYIGFNLLEDYLSAKQLFNDIDDAEVIKNRIKNLLFEGIDEMQCVNYRNIAIFAMAASMYANQYGYELIDIIDDIDDEGDKYLITKEYLESMVKRNNVSYNDFIELIKNYPADRQCVRNIFIEHATKKHSELNADGLTKFLFPYELNKRDHLWTTQINQLSQEDRIVNLVYYIEEGTMVFTDVEKTRLLLTLFAWFLSSSKRALRDRVSKAMIEILKDNFQLCLPLLIKFNNVNDPYIIQRLYGIIFGAVMKRTKKFDTEYEKLAEWIMDNIFLTEKVYPDILLRDYARLIIERFAYEYPNAVQEWDLERSKPPYKSDPIPKAKVIDYSAEKYGIKGTNMLIYSMTFNAPIKGRGMYGDFGRYIFQSALRDFVDLDVTNIFYYSMEYIFDEIGYTSELFGRYDSSLPMIGRHHAKKIERIGKKYQWIAMYNILARIADTHKIKHWWSDDEEGKIYIGPWEPNVRDFDPTMNIRYGINPDAPKITLPRYGMTEFLTFDVSEEKIQEWVNIDSNVFMDFPERLMLKDEFGIEWVTLYHYTEENFIPPNSDEDCSGFPKGKQTIWAISTAYLKKSPSGSNQILEYLEQNNFAKRNPNIQRCYSLYSREYAWSLGYAEEFKVLNTEESDFEDIIPAEIQMLWEGSYDASQDDEATSFFIPAGEIINFFGLEERKYDGFYYSDDELVAFDLVHTDSKNHELVIKKDYIQRFLRENSYSLFWSVIGEKQYFTGGYSQIFKRREGYFVFEEEKIIGSIKLVDNE